AGLALASLLSPVFLGHAFGHSGDAGFFLGVALFVAVISFFAARILVDQVAAAEALRTVSPLAALIGAFVFLRWAAGGGATHMDGLTEASIRTFLIADAGLASLARLPGERTARAPAPAPPRAGRGAPPRAAAGGGGNSADGSRGAARLLLPGPAV